MSTQTAPRINNRAPSGREGFYIHSYRHEKARAALPAGCGHTTDF
jgi:hypothetical protein